MACCGCGCLWCGCSFAHEYAGTTPQSVLDGHQASTPFRKHFLGLMAAKYALSELLRQRVFTSRLPMPSELDALFHAILSGGLGARSCRPARDVARLSRGLGSKAGGTQD